MAAIKWAGGGAQPPERNPYIVLSAGVPALNSAIALAVLGSLVCVALAAVTIANKSGACAAWVIESEKESEISQSQALNQRAIRGNNYSF